MNSPLLFCHVHCGSVEPAPPTEFSASRKDAAPACWFQAVLDIRFSHSWFQHRTLQRQEHRIRLAFCFTVLSQVFSLLPHHFFQCWSGAGLMVAWMSSSDCQHRVLPNHWRCLTQKQGLFEGWYLSGSANGWWYLGRIGASEPEACGVDIDAQVTNSYQPGFASIQENSMNKSFCSV